MDLWRMMEIPAAELGQGTSVEVRVGGNVDDLARAMADEMAALLRASVRTGRGTTWIVPVGPVGQYSHLVRIIRDEGLDCSGLTLINMDEFLGDDGDLIAADHPLSFRGFMQRELYDRLPDCGLRPENRIFPDPARPGALAEAIQERGGVDACFGGIGLNGHIAFNEPRPELPVEAFADLPTRVLDIEPASRAHMAVNLSCPVDLIPGRAVTVGMREILAADHLSFHANRPWQRGVVRQLLHGPVSPGFPASYLQQHPNATLTIAGFLAEPVEVHLR